MRNKAIVIYIVTGATGFSLGLVVGGLMTEIGRRRVFFLPSRSGSSRCWPGSGSCPEISPPRARGAPSTSRAP